MNGNVSGEKYNAVSGQNTQQAQHVVYHDFHGSAELTTTLAHAISDVTGIDVTDTGFTLNDYVDPDALDRLFRPRDGMQPQPQCNSRFSLTIWGCQVTVYDTGRIVITPSQHHHQPRQPRQ